MIITRLTSKYKLAATNRPLLQSDQHANKKYTLTNVEYLKYINIEYLNTSCTSAWSSNILGNTFLEHPRPATPTSFDIQTACLGQSYLVITD